RLAGRAGELRRRARRAVDADSEADAALVAQRAAGPQVRQVAQVPQSARRAQPQVGEVRERKLTPGAALVDLADIADRPADHDAPAAPAPAARGERVQERADVIERPLDVAHLGGQAADQVVRVAAGVVESHRAYLMLGARISRKWRATRCTLQFGDD